MDTDKEVQVMLHLQPLAGFAEGGRRQSGRLFVRSGQRLVSVRPAQ